MVQRSRGILHYFFHNIKNGFFLFFYLSYMYMEYIFKAPPIAKIIFIVLIIIYSVVPVLSVPSAFKEVKWKISGTIIAYVCLSPLLILFLYLLVNTASIEIKINPDYILYAIKNDKISLQTKETEYFIYNYVEISGGNSYKVFALGNSIRQVRFTYRLSSEEIGEIGETGFLKGELKKSFKFSSYGLTLYKKECLRLVRVIMEYTGLKPVLKPDFFN